MSNDLRPSVEDRLLADHLAHVGWIRKMVDVVAMDLTRHERGEWDSRNMYILSDLETENMIREWVWDR